MENLKQLMTEYSNTPALQLPEAHRRKIHWRHRGTDVEAETAERLRLQTARSALQDKDDGRAVTHLVLIEAKAYPPWTNKQLASKAKRLKEIFGDGGKAHDAVKPHFVLMTGRLSGNIDTDSWPDWMSDGGNLRWLTYNLPTRTKVTRCTDRGRHSKNGSHLRLDPVPPAGE